MTEISKPLMTPGMPDLVRTIRSEIFSSLNCCKIGKIISFNGTKKTAEIQIMFKRKIGDKVEPYPLLVDCPIFTLQGGGGAVYMPVQAGDPCLVLFADRNIDIWYSTGNEAAPANQRCHDLSDGIAFVGINSLADSLADYPADELRVMHGGARVAIKGGQVNIQNATASLLEILQDMIDGIQGGTYSSGSFVDTTGLMTAAESALAALLFKDT